MEDVQSSLWGPYLPFNPTTATLQNKQRPVKITADDFKSSVSDFNKEVFRSIITDGAIQALKAGRSFYLDHFGILLPTKDERRRINLIKSKLVINSETILSTQFEKCGDLTPFLRKHYGNPIEASSLSSFFVALFPSYNERELKRLIRGYIQSIKEETVSRGFSDELPCLGTLFSLHNRQGLSLNDWFAGADIFLQPRFELVLSANKPQIMERAIIKSPWEIMNAAFDTPASISVIKPKAILHDLGFEVEKNLQIPEAVNIAQYILQISNTKKISLVCTDGLRLAGIKVQNKGCEIVSQIETDQEDSEISEWQRTALAVSCALVCAHKNGLPTNGSLAGKFSCSPMKSLTHIMLTPCTKFCSEHLCSEGIFRLLSVIGITEDEALAMANGQKKQILAAFKRRGLDQVTRARRSSILGKVVH